MVQADRHKHFFTYPHDKFEDTVMWLDGPTGEMRSCKDVKMLLSTNT